MNELICDQIAEKLRGGEFLHWNSKHIIGWMLNQTWIYPGIFALELDEDDDICVLYHPEGSKCFLCSRSQLTSDILNLAHQYDLEDRERSYLLSKIPKSKKDDRSAPRRCKPKPPEFTICAKALRVTSGDGQQTYHDAEEQEDLEKFCRKNNYTLHKNVRGEWRQIIP